MEQTKQNLTLVITRINEAFPDDKDLKGLLGVSKALMTDSLLQSDALLIPLKEYDNNFEVIVLKRELNEMPNLSEPLKGIRIFEIYKNLKF